MFCNMAQKWGEVYRKFQGKVDILAWSDDTDSSTARAITRAVGCLAPAWTDTTGYQLRTGFGTPKLLIAMVTTEDAAGATAAYLRNNKELRDMFFPAPYDLSDISAMDFSEVGGCPLEEGSLQYCWIDQTTGAANQNTGLAMIYYDGLPAKDILQEGEEVEQIVQVTMSVTPTANTIGFPGDDVISGFVTGTDLPSGARNRYALLKMTDVFTTISDSLYAVRHPEFTDHMFIIPMARAIYSQNTWNGPGWKFDGDAAPRIGIYGQAGGAAIVGVQVAVLP
jgi:hypothetical protein